MAITRINQFEARTDAADKLHAFLEAVIGVVAACPGCVSCRLLRSIEKAECFAIIEEWESVEAHQAAARAIPREKLAEAAAMFAKPPAGMYYKN